MLSVECRVQAAVQRSLSGVLATPAKSAALARAARGFRPLGQPRGWLARHPWPCSVRRASDEPFLRGSPPRPADGAEVADESVGTPASSSSSPGGGGGSSSSGSGGAAGSGRGGAGNGGGLGWDIVSEPLGREVVEKAADAPPVPLVTDLTPSREFDVKQSFLKFPFRREVQLGLMRMGVSVPTRVQDITIHKILAGISVFMLAQTGTGKSLAYICPIVHKLLDSNAEGFFPMGRKPRAIILQPTRELAMQTIKVVRNFPVRSCVLAAGHSFIKESQALHAGADVVVATPGRLILHLGKENMFLHQVRHLVLDEADTLCDTYYEADAKKLLQGLHKDCALRPQVVIVGATRTGAVSSFLARNMGATDVLPVVSTDAHLTPPQVDQVFMPTRGKRRLAVLWDVMSEMPAVGRKTLVFTNRVPTCKAVFRGMLEHGHSAVALHGNAPAKTRKKAWMEFQGTGADVMVCTNLASRGLDFSNVHHVIMYDFPLNLADYLHRVGRTARGGRAGRVTTITPKRYWPFVAKIQDAAREGRPIEVKNASTNMKKVLALHNYEKLTQSGIDGWKQRRLRKRLGLPPAMHLGPQVVRRARREIRRKALAVKKLKFLQKRGIIKKGHGLPQMPDFQVEASDSQSVSTMIRARDGLLQVIPRRRKRPEQDLPGSHLGELDQPGGRPISKAANQRRRRPVM